MAKNERIPEGVRKAINRISPGRYVDPATGRVYVDSADMDGSFEAMQDDVRYADETRHALRKLDEQREKPPPEIEDLAQTWLLRHAQRLEDTTGWRKRAEGRRTTIEGKRRFKRSIGSDLDEEDLDELAAIEAALKENEMHERKCHLPSREVVSGKYDVLTDPDADPADRIQSGEDLVEAIDHHGKAVPLPEGLTREEFEGVVPAMLEDLRGEALVTPEEESRVGATDANPDGPPAGEKLVSNVPNPTRHVRVTLHKGPLDGRVVTVGTHWPPCQLFIGFDGERGEVVSNEPLRVYPQHVYRCPAHVGKPPAFTADARYDRTDSGNATAPESASV
jgi:hypothetical protein